MIEKCYQGAVILMTADGFILDKKVVGEIPELPDEES